MIPTSTPVIEFLQRHDAAGGLLPTAQRALALQGDLQALLPAPLRDRCAVSAFDAETITLGVSSAGMAAKLRQTLPRLQDGLVERGWKVNAIRIRVQPKGSPTVSSTWVTGTGTSIPSGGVDAFVALREALDDSPLRAAVERLIGRRRKR